MDLPDPKKLKMDDDNKPAISNPGVVAEALKQEPHGEGVKQQPAAPAPQDIVPPPNLPQAIQDLKTKLLGLAEVYLRISGDSDDAKDYDTHRYQYALSSYFQAGRMQPLAIIYPQPDTADDTVMKVIKYAIDNNVHIAVRSGGHQYSGASSTMGDNIQLDLSEAYPALEKLADENGKPRIKVGVSNSIRVMNDFLGKLGLFVPHGQCSHVHVGGHAQTGGYGQLSRSFGLFSDHIVSFEIITATDENGNPTPTKRTVKRVSDNKDPEEARKEADLYYAVLGGSPGNYGVLTNIVLEPHQDKDHPNSRGLKYAVLYDKVTGPDILRELVQLQAELSENDEYPGDYDFCMTLMSARDRKGDPPGNRQKAEAPLAYFGRPEDDIDQQMQQCLGSGDNEASYWPTGIILFVQWANLGGEDQEYHPYLFDRIKQICQKPGVRAGVMGVKDAAGNLIPIDNTTHLDMSFLTKAWVFENVREFLKPYKKRTWVSNSTTLAKDGFADLLTKQVTKLIGQETKYRLVVQVEHFGGKYSNFRNNGLKRIPPWAKAMQGTEEGQTYKDRKTAFSWRDDTTIILGLDAFYAPDDDKAKERVIEWQAENDYLFKGPQSKFAKEDRRVLWSSYGDLDLSNIWQAYYEDFDKYKRLCDIRNQVDPNKVFCGNTFCVGGGDISTGSADPWDVTVKCDETHSENLFTKCKERAKNAIKPTTAAEAIVVVSQGSSQAGH